MIDYDEVTARSWRRYPSASARHPIETYVLAQNVSGLEPDAYWYNPYSHGLERMWIPDDDWRQVHESQRDLAGAEQCGGYPAVVLLLTAVFARTMWKYRNLGLSLVYKDAGCATQCLATSATAAGLGFKPVRGGRERENAQLLGLDAMIESQVGGCLAGWAADPGRTGHRE